MKRTCLYLLVFLFCPCVIVSAYEQSRVLSFFQHSGDKIKITAKQCDTRRVPGGYEVVLEGNARVSQGESSLTCERLALLFKKGDSRDRPANPSKQLSVGSANFDDLRSANALGNVKIVYKETMGTSGKLLYDHLKRTVTLLDGPPRLWQGKDVIKAQTIIIYLDENRIEFKGGGGPEDSIQMTIDPPKNTKEKK